MPTLDMFAATLGIPGAAIPSAGTAGHLLGGLARLVADRSAGHHATGSTTTAQLDFNPDDAVGPVMTSNIFVCRICGGTSSLAIKARERMFGTGEEFDYFQCAKCGCVQIAQYPEELGRYYPSSYYSFDRIPRSLKSNLKRIVRVAIIRLPRIPARLREAIIQRDLLVHIIRLYSDVIRNRHAAILDVGSGIGKALELGVDAGFDNLSGIDAFISEDIVYRDRPLVRKATIFSIERHYDIVSFNHSLEHMPDQRKVLAQARRLLTKGGCVIVRIPVVGGDAWERYREKWVQFDAPRHLYLHSLESLSVLAAQCGMRVQKVSYDSTSFQYWGSELYRRGLPLVKNRPQGLTDEALPFSKQELAAFQRAALQANQSGRGDQIVALLYRAEQH